MELLTVYCYCYFCNEKRWSKYLTRDHFNLNTTRYYFNVLLITNSWEYGNSFRMDANLNNPFLVGQSDSSIDIAIFRNFSQQFDCHIDDFFMKHRKLMLYFLLILGICSLCYDQSNPSIKWFGRLTATKWEMFKKRKNQTHNCMRVMPLNPGCLLDGDCSRKEATKRSIL